MLKTPSPEAAVRLCPTISVPAPCQESGWQSAATSALPHNGKAPSSANLYLCLCGSKIILSLKPGGGRLQMLSPDFLDTLLGDEAITGLQNKNSGSQEKVRSHTGP